MIIPIDNRPLFQLTVSEFNNLLKSVLPNETFAEPIKTPQDKVRINGIRGLAAFLDISIPTAQKLKNQKKFPFYESGNKVYFFSNEVNEGLRVNAKEKGNRR